jgi:hypothetical protein
MRSEFAALVLVLATGLASAVAADPVVTAVVPSTAIRGTRVALEFSAAPGDTPLWLWLKSREPIPTASGIDRLGKDGPFGPFPIDSKPSEAGDDKKTKRSCLVPAMLPLGQYDAAVSASNNKPDHPPPAFTAPLTLTRDGNRKPVLSAVYPTTNYPGGHTLVLLGDNFSEVPEDHILIIDGRDELRLRPATPPEPGQPPTVEAGVKFHSPHKIEVFGTRLGELRGRVGLRVRVGDDVSEPVTLTVSTVRRWVPLLVGALLTVLLGAFFFLVARNVGRYQIGGQSYSPFAVLFLDKETDTYSLSKFQLIAWTTAALFGYAYLMAARNLVQGTFEFPPVPENLPGLMLVSVGTTALATGITAARGPKGAGGVHPSIADFITTGGVVSAERLQFFVWTVVGVLSFLFLVASSDPAALHELPKVPESFLYLMGVSSAGYLGGKLARRPGPVIDSVVAQQGSLIVEIRGRRLSRRARFEIDGHEVTYRTGEPLPAGEPAAADARLEVLRPDEEAQDPDFAGVLRLTLLDVPVWSDRHTLPAAHLAPGTAQAAGQPAPAKPRLALINPDGQRAEAEFDVLPRPS